MGNEDKREIIREIMAVAGKSNDDFEGGEDEKVREIAKLAERLAYEPSETSKSDNEDKRKEIDEVGGFLKDKGLSDEDIRFVIGKMEKDAYAPSEDSKSDNEDKDADNEDKDADTKTKTQTTIKKKIRRQITRVNRITRPCRLLWQRLRTPLPVSQQKKTQV